MVKGILNHDNCIAMIQEKNKPEPRLWKLVGGTAEDGESVITTAAREVKEEIGITLYPLSENNIVYEAELKGKHGVHDFILVEGRYLAGEIKLGDEVERVAFFTPAQIREMIKRKQVIKSHADALRAYL
ncbi:MAG: NUDIX domain-containing protein [Candidatus Paceibacterota bacterium]